MYFPQNLRILTHMLKKKLAVSFTESPVKLYGTYATNKIMGQIRNPFLYP